MSDLPTCFVRLLASAMLAIVALTACTSSQDQGQLPPYAQREGGGAVRIDVEKASGGSAKLDRGNQIILTFEGNDIPFMFGATSGAIELSSVLLTEPAVRISPVLTPRDGVADIFAALWIDVERQELHVDVFLDTDWRSERIGDIYIHSEEFIERKAQFRKIAIDFAEGIHDIYHQELVFVDGGELFLCGSPKIWITNISGETIDIINKMGRLNLEKEDVVIGFGSEVC